MTATQTQTLRMERTFDAAPEEVWDAWTDPKQYAKWISPYPGLEAEVHEMDPRVGGKVSFTMYGPNGAPFPRTTFTYEKLDKPREMVLFEPNDDRTDVFANHPMRTTARFDAAPGGKTRLTLVIAGLPAAFPIDMAQQGFGACLDKLAQVVREPKGKTLRLERTFDAAPEDVWAAWTDPKQYAKWFNPSPIDLVIHEWDLRVGGKISFDMPQPNGDRNPQHGVFHVVSPYTELVSGEPDKSFLVATRFEPRAGRTHVRVDITGLPPEYREPATMGWNVIFDRLAAHLKK